MITLRKCGSYWIKSARLLWKYNKEMTGCRVISVDLHGLWIISRPKIRGFKPQVSDFMLWAQILKIFRLIKKHHKPQNIGLWAKFNSSCSNSSIPVFQSASGRWEVLGLAYKQHETRDNQQFGRDLDRDWCHRHTSIKLSWSQPMDQWVGAAAQCPWSHGLWPEKLYTSLAMTPVPIQWSLIPSFASL